MRLLQHRKIKLLVTDMTGTIVNDNGAFYKCIARALQKLDYVVDKNEIKTWHGKGMEEILYSHISKFHSNKTDISPCVLTASNIADYEIDKEYFSKGSELELFSDVTTTLERLRFQGIKIALTTGKSKILQSRIVDKVGLSSKIDTFVSKDDVRKSRPYPYMIFKAMEDNLITDVKKVASIGDTRLDILMGKSAGCRLVVGATTGISSKRDLSYESHFVIDNFCYL